MQVAPRTTRKRARSASKRTDKPDTPACNAWLLNLPPYRRSCIEYELDVCARLPVYGPPSIPAVCVTAAEALCSQLPQILENNLRLLVLENLGFSSAVNADALCVLALQTVMPELLIDSTAHFISSQREIAPYEVGAAAATDEQRLQRQAQQCEWTPAAAAFAATQYQLFYAGFIAFLLSEKDDSPLRWATEDDILRVVARRYEDAEMVPAETALLFYALTKFCDNATGQFQKSTNDLAMSAGMRLLELLREYVPVPAIKPTQQDSVFSKSLSSVEAHLCELLCRPYSDVFVVRSFMAKHMGLRLQPGAYALAPIVHQLLSLPALSELHLRPRPSAFTAAAVKDCMFLRKVVQRALHAAHGGGDEDGVNLSKLMPPREYEEVMQQTLEYVNAAMSFAWAATTRSADSDSDGVLASYVSLCLRMQGNLRRRDLRRLKFTICDVMLPVVTQMVSGATTVTLLTYFQHVLSTRRARRTILQVADSTDALCYAFCNKEGVRSVTNALQPARTMLFHADYVPTPERICGIRAARDRLGLQRRDVVSANLAYATPSALMLMRAVQQLRRTDPFYEDKVSKLVGSCALMWQAARAVRETLLQQVCYAVPADVRADALVKCTVCDEAFVETAASHGCGTHSVCLPCAVRCIESRAVDVISKTAWLSSADMLRCAMAPSCALSMQPAVLQLVGPEFRYVVEVLGNEPKLRPHSHPCFQCWDRVVLTTPEQGVVATCGTCRARMCTMCECVEHPGWLCPSAMAGGPTPELLLTEAKTQRCPTCGVATTKDAGCNHISCPCKTNWCWICGVALTDTAAHYSSTTSTCGQFTYDIEYETKRMRQRILARTDVPNDVKTDALSLLSSMFAQDDDDM